MGSGTTREHLFGGVDLKAFEADETKGELRYLPQKSFMAHEYVIFEELMDAPDYVLEQLKDILSSGVFHNGAEDYEVKTKLIVCCTNHTREMFAKNQSLKALMERFPLENEVKWKAYNEHTYKQLLDVKFGAADPLLVYVLNAYAKRSKIISPRIAATAQRLMEICGPDCLEFIADFRKEPELASDVEKFKGVAKIKTLSRNISELIIQIGDIASMIASPAAVKEKTAQNKELYKLLNELKGIKADDSIAAELTNISKKTELEYQKNIKALQLLTTFE